MVTLAAETSCFYGATFSAFMCYAGERFVSQILFWCVDHWASGQIKKQTVGILQIEQNSWRVHAYHVFILKQPSANNQNGDDLGSWGREQGQRGLGGFSQPS